MLSASIFAGFGVAHLIDDFLFAVPAEFNLSNPAAQVLALVFFIALTGLIASAARRNPQSYRGLILIGLLLALADTLKHVPEIQPTSQYRSGSLSIFFATGLILSGLVTALVAWEALQHSLQKK